MKKLNFPIAFVLCLILMGLYFAFIIVREPKHLAQKPNIQDVLETNLEDNYPATPEDVILFYGKILSCLLNETLDENQINMLETQARELMDRELLENYQQAQYANDMSQRIKQYQKRNISYALESINPTKDIKYHQKGGANYAVVTQTYYTHRNNTYTKHKSVYTLRKSNNGKWLIYSFT